ncbi:MAG TPA: GMC oxidoreductase, partial [Acidimicrobiales bacterium]|nr:GMC oxidoreductase [Acidimicrobiales bacterium]
QLTGIRSEPHGNQAVVSGAYGGFSTVWGAQVMPFTPGVLARWPISSPALTRSYRAVLKHLPFAGVEDDLAGLFPLLVEPQALPPISPRSMLTLGNYERNRRRLQALGITMGRARLALDAGACVRCGLCMTGCPYSLVYSANTTMDALRQSGRITYRSGVLVHKVEEDEDGVVVHTTGPGGREPAQFRAERVFLACGGVGTARVVVNSLGAEGEELVLHESRQFAVPFLSRRATPDPRVVDDFTLNQFNMAVAFDEEGIDLSVIHFYSYNPAVLAGVPALLKRRWASPLLTRALTRLTVALGYVPSWRSPTIRLRFGKPGASGLGSLSLTEEPTGAADEFFAQVLRRLRQAAPHLDLWPLARAAFVSGPGKSYHFGGTFPHSPGRDRSPYATDRLGRLRQWQRVHIVDGSVLPDIPATTFTLTVMANAHRIAREVARSGR